MSSEIKKTIDLSGRYNCKKIKLIRAGLINSVVDSKLSSQELDELLRTIKEREQTLISKSSSSEIELSEESQFSKLNESEDEEVVYSQLQAFPDVPDDLLNSTPTNENQDPHISSISTSKTGENEKPDISEIPSNDQPPQVNPFFYRPQMFQNNLQTFRLIINLR